MTLDQYESREFAEEEIVFSSFTYLIDVVRIIGATMEANLEYGVPLDSILDRANIRWMNWFLYLPPSKQDMVGANGRTNEIIFQAHMLINT
jgi:hypothetical protein